MKNYRKSAEAMLDFVHKSPTAFHAVANIKKMLCDAGYVELAETEDWEIQPGHGYFVTRNDSSLIAFFVPQMPIRGFHIVASTVIPRHLR